MLMAVATKPPCADDVMIVDESTARCRCEWAMRTSTVLTSLLDACLRVSGRECILAGSTVPAEGKVSPVCWAAQARGDGNDLQ